MTVALEMRAISSGYGDVRVLRDVSLVVPPGEVTVMLGRNGAGKSTTLLTLAGVLKPYTGSVWLGNRELTAVPAHKRPKQGIALVQEGKQIFKQRTVEENLVVGAWAAKSPRSARREIHRQYDLFPILARRRSDLAGSLSGGQQQMVAIAQALMAQPKVLMLDEPSAGLAPGIVLEILGVIRRLREQGIAILLVEQLVDQAMSVADSVVVLDAGRVVHSGTAPEASSHELLKSLYLGAQV
jgi:branched-chain amino acid transport system ATP-binding protein